MKKCVMYQMIYLRKRQNLEDDNRVKAYFIYRLTIDPNCSRSNLKDLVILVVVVMWSEHPNLKYAAVVFSDAWPAKNFCRSHYVDDVNSASFVNFVAKCVVEYCAAALLIIVAAVVAVAACTLTFDGKRKTKKKNIRKIEIIIE